MANNLLIPSAKIVAPEMQLDFGLIPPVLLPLGSTAVLDYIIDSLQFDNCFIGLHDEYQRVQDYLINKTFKSELVYVDSNNSLKENQLGFTIQYLLNKSGVKSGDSVLINFADTIVLKNDCKVHVNEARDVIYTATSDDTFRWTTLIADTGVVRFFDKNRLDKPQSSNIAVGLFFIKNALRFSEILKLEIDKRASNAVIDNDSFYDALEIYLNERNQYDLIEADQWIDLGHLDTFYQSKARFLNARHFNSFEIDLFWGKIRKKSLHQKKFINEINWYVNLPVELKSLIPNVYSHSTSAESVFIDMEYYGYPTLNQTYLFSNISLSQWKTIFNKLLSIHSQFNTFSKSVDSSLFKSFYLDKTIQRLDELKNDVNFVPFFDHDITINGSVYPSLSELIKSLPGFIDSYIIDNNNLKAAIIHGDLCLSNILFDIKTGIIKLIDPRGSFTDNDVFGDPRYDLAKLMHSVHGLYDLILAGNYKLEEDGLKFDFKIYDSKDHAHLSSLLIELLRKGGINVQQIKAIESLLFLSMVPLHADDLKRQKAFLLRGIELFYAVTNS